jgi:hypothetical protein
MAMVDPARHVHPGIPYDFFSGYLVMVADNISPTTGNTAYVTLLGELPRDVEAELQRDNYGRVNQGSDEIGCLKSIFQLHKCLACAQACAQGRLRG